MSDARAGFGAQSTTDEVLEGIDLNGKVILITGGSSGLGAEAARALASKGAKVIVTGRDLDKAQGVLDEIRQRHPSAQIEVEALDLASLASVRAFAERIRGAHERIDVLINNAGVMACAEGKTEEGFERQFGTNHLGHFLLTHLLLPLLPEGGRVVALSSAAHRMSPVVFEDIQYEEREYDKWTAYGQSKTANILFAVALNERLKGRGVEAFAVHPGVIRTGLTRHMPEDELQGLMASLKSRGTVEKTVEQGAATEVWAATAPELSGKGGSYLADCQVGEVDGGNAATFVCSYAVDKADAERLWTLSEQMVGLA